MDNPSKLIGKVYKDVLLRNIVSQSVGKVGAVCGGCKLITQLAQWTSFI